MFGYITINKGELKVKEFEYYKSCYCGLCGQLRKDYGQTAGIMLSYDMTFLSLFLSSLYEKDYDKQVKRCMRHPCRKQMFQKNQYTEYASHMTLLLMYHKLLDNWKDEKSVLSRLGATAIKNRYKKTAKRYPRQVKAIEEYMKETARYEAEQQMIPEEQLEALSSCTGNMLREIFLYYEKDVWQETLQELAFYLGKYIYILDAYDDLEKDRKEGAFNPLFAMENEQGFENKIYDFLNIMGAMAAKQFEKLPIIENASLLRNILYSGMWEKYEEIRRLREKRRAEEQKNDV